MRFVERDACQGGKWFHSLPSTGGPSDLAQLVLKAQDRMEARSN